MQQILNKLKTKTTRSTTAKTYFCVWRQFNNFIIKLDSRPDTWEDRISLFGAYLVEHKGVQSGTLKSYYSAIKAVLREDGYIVDDTKVLLSSLVKACRLENDRVKTRLPIQLRLLEILLFELERIFEHQPYLECMYKTLFLSAYYGMFRIGELATGDHPVRACNIHVAQNKEKLLYVLYTSKTHGLESRPPKIKISANEKYYYQGKSGKQPNRFFCPFQLSRKYLALRGNYFSDDDPFFIHRDHNPVTPAQVRKVLRMTLQAVNLPVNMYGCHSFRIGCCTDLVKHYGAKLDDVHIFGRWRSNSVYKYIRTFQ